MASETELVQRLRALDSSRRPWHGPGAVGQTVGCESWRIVATGNQLAVLDEAAASIEQLTRERDEARADAARYRWLRDRFVGLDFAWNSPPLSVLCFEMRGMTDCGKDVTAAIDAALASALPTPEKPRG